MPDGGVAPGLFPPGWDWRRPDYDAVWQQRLERLQRMREAIKQDPGALDQLKAHYAENAHDFINHWLVTVDPRNPEIGLPARIPLLMFQRQDEFITWVYERWAGRENGVCDKSRDSGMTWLCVGFAVWMWLFVPGATVGFGSRKEEYVDDSADPKSIFWKIRTAIAALPAEFKPIGYVERKHAPFMQVSNPENGAIIVGEAGDNIGRGNRTSIYFVDEAAFIERAEKIDAALSETTNCRIDISTPNGVGNPFWEKRHSGRVPVFTFHWKDDPRKGPEWYAKKKATLRPSVVAQEIDIDYEASIDNQAVELWLVNRAMQTDKTAVSTEGKMFLGVDVARFGKNKSVVSIRKNRAVIYKESRGKIDTEDVAGWVKSIVDRYGGIRKFGALCIDDIGVGGGVTDKLKRWYRRKVVGVNVSLRVDNGRDYNLRAKLVNDFVEWLRDAPNHLPNDPELKAQMGSIQKEYRGGLMLIESKEDMVKRGVKSPDDADSVFLTFASPEIQDEDDGPAFGPPVIHDPGMGI